jgi:dipicolinate synthase subunit A
MKISIIGGDKRNLYLKELLEKEGHNVIAWGFDKLTPNTISLKEALKSKLIICPIPFAKEGSLVAPFSTHTISIDILSSLSNQQLVIAGGISKANLNIAYIDILNNESFLRKNAIATAEGVIALAIQETEITMHNSNITIIGAGRIGKLCASYFKSLGSNVTVVVSKSGRIPAESTPYQYVLHQNMQNCLRYADIIVSTPPGDALNKAHIPKINKNAIIIDVSSKPYGVSQDVEQAVKTFRPQSIPGKISPKTAAEYIRDEVIKIINKA